MSVGLTDERLDGIYARHLEALADEVVVTSSHVIARPARQTRGVATGARSLAWLVLLGALLATMAWTISTVGQALQEVPRFEAGSLAFARGADLFVSRPDGSGAVRIAAGTPGSNEIQKFAFSPDRSAIAYAQVTDPDTGSEELVLLGADGRTLGSFLGARATRGIIFSWAPDGQRLAVYPGQTEGEIALIGRDGQTLDGLELPLPNVTRLAWFEFASLSWSPDGTWIAVPVRRSVGTPPCASSGKEETCYLLIASDGTGTVGLTDGSSGYLAWAPDGRVAVTHWPEGSVEVWPADRASSQIIPLPDRQQPVDGHALAWSPDGSRLMVAAAGRFGQVPEPRLSQIYLISDDGVLAPLDIDPRVSISMVAWVPGTERILFSGSGSIWSVGADGGIPSRLTEADGPIFDVASVTGP